MRPARIPTTVPGPQHLELLGMDVALEFNRCLKQLAGWRVAMAVGNPVAVRALAW